MNAEGILKRKIYQEKSKNNKFNCASISVIIPVFNTEAYLERCLKSILNNTYRNLEIICINDGSTDQSLDVLNKYSEIDPRVRILNKVNEGVSKARNDGLNEATGDYITFIDSDDWIHRQYFEILINNIVKFDADIAVCGFISLSSSQMEESVYCSNSIEARRYGFSDIMKDNYLKSFACGRLYKRTAIENYRFPEGIKLGEDTIFNMNIISSLKNVELVLVDAVLYYYFNRATSATNTIKCEYWMPFCRWFLEHISVIEDKGKKGIFLEEAVKKLLAIKYLLSYRKIAPNFVQEQSCLEKMCWAYLFDFNIEMLFYKRIILFIFLKVPQLYRCFRIITDSTMLEWERNEKRRIGKNI